MSPANGRPENPRELPIVDVRRKEQAGEPTLADASNYSGEMTHFVALQLSALDHRADSVPPPKIFNSHRVVPYAPHT